LSLLKPYLVNHPRTFDTHGPNPRRVAEREEMDIEKLIEKLSLDEKVALTRG
jgi:hypothetical protein